MEEIRLQEWQAHTIKALVGQRERVAQQAQETVDGINATLKRYAEEWGDGEGPLIFNQRPDGLYLVQVNDETPLAPAD